MAFVALVPLTTVGTFIVGLFVQAVHGALLGGFADFPLNVSLYFAGHVASTFVVVVCVAYWRERLLRQAFADGIKTREEKEAFKAHLLSFTSMEALRRTQDDARSIADVFGEATVLFCDIVDFTALAERIAPRHLVEVLSTVFLTLDELAARHRVEKVKTIGDAYMAIAVASEGGRNAAENIADFALAVMRASGALSEVAGCPIRFRIGMHTGSVVGGVVGRQKMTYDYWGRPVNVASRLETTGEPGRIQVSEATYLRLKRSFRFEKRGPIDLKGIGATEAYLLTSRLAGAEAEAAGETTAALASA
jgi:class 3 adenylate cyclase